VDCKSTWLVRHGPYLREKIDQRRTLQAGTPVVQFTATLGDLTPGTPYTLRQTMFYESTESMVSPFSGLFMTHPVTVPGPIPPPAQADTAPAVVTPNQGQGKKKKKKKAVAGGTVLTGVVVGGLRAVPGDLPTR
jgi:hypothetical protein